MKKIMMALVAVVMMFVLTGCGTETLTCTMSQTQAGMKMNQEMNATFVNNEVTKMDITMDAEIDEAYASQMDQIKASVEANLKQYKDNGGELDITSEGNVIKAKINLDLSKMSKDQKKNLNVTDVYGTKDATKKELEKEGYTCK